MMSLNFCLLTIDLYLENALFNLLLWMLIKRYPQLRALFFLKLWQAQAFE